MLLSPSIRHSIQYHAPRDLYSEAVRVSFKNDIPYDILVEIYDLLDLRTLASLRQTCRRCHEVSKDRVVWSRIYRRLEHLTSPHTRRYLDQPLSDYSPEEIETMVLTMASLASNWTKPNPTPRSVHKMKLNSALVHLVPGGRWLITSSGEPHWRIICYDLRDLGRPPFDLVDASALLECPIPRHLVCSVNGDAKGLDFDMAILYRAKDTVSMHITGKPVCVWRVSYDRTRDRLLATHRKTFGIHGKSMNIARSSIYGPRYLCGRLREDPLVFPLLEIIHWDECEEGRQKKSVIELDFIYGMERFCAFQLLPNDQVAVFKMGVVHVYDIPKPQDVSGSDIGPISRLGPCWTYRYEPPPTGPSLSIPVQPAFSSKEDQIARFAVCDSQTMYQFTIPEQGRNQSTEVSICHFGPSWSRDMVYFGARRGFRWSPAQDRTTMKFFDYWPPQESTRVEEYGFPSASPRAISKYGNGSFTTSYSSYNDSGPRQEILWRFDEQSGVIVMRFVDKHIRILLFA